VGRPKQHSRPDAGASIHPRRFRRIGAPAFGGALFDLFQRVRDVRAGVLDGAR
jgi:hypothetical protein